MSPSARNPAIAYHDRVAPRYDDIYEGPYWDFVRAVTWEMWKPHLPRDAAAKIIDLGCGTGTYGLRLAKSGFRVTFLDISQKMIDVAARKAEEMGLSEKVDFVRANLCDLSALPREAFAFAVAEGDPICLASKPAKAVKEIHGILAQGGILAASLDNACAGLDYYMEKGDIEGLDRFCRTGTATWLAERQEERFPVQMFTPDEARDLFTRAGFEILSVRGKTVLPLRMHPEPLSDRGTFQRLLHLELKLNKVEAYLGRASHLEVIARKT